MKPTEITVAELGQTQCKDLGASDWLVVEQRRINLFADATDDHQWIHVDRQRATEGPFGTTIAHGYLTLALVPRMLEELLQVVDQGRGTNYGLDRVRFTTPVHVGSQIRLAAKLLESKLRPDGGVQYTVSLRIEVRGQERPAMVATSVYLAYPE